MFKLSQIIYLKKSYKLSLNSLFHFAVSLDENKF